MSLEDLEPRPRGGAALAELMREDLSTYAVEDLRERVARLEAEIVRARTAIEAKTAGKSAADALFSFKS